MPISVECPSCRVAFRVKDEAAGKRGLCPQCKTKILVPAALPSAPEEIGLVPIDDEPKAAAKATLVPIAPGKNKAIEEDDSAGYALAGGVAKKARGVQVRKGALPAAFAGAEGVKHAAAPTAKTRTPREILAAFRGEIEPVRPSAMYVLWSLIVALFMLLLPIVYIGLIGLIVYGLYYHAVNHFTIFEHAGRGSRVAMLVYVTPLIGGVMMVAFLLKPLFARAGTAAKERELDPEVEPLLFAFIDGICATVGAPTPARVVVNTEVNAAAGYTGGAFSIFNREPVLTIGLGMVAGLSLKQFAGVLAHELGHISQGTGQRLSVIIGSINLWFARVVYERDEWDQTLLNWTNSGSGYSLIGGIARLAVWLTRRVLWVLLCIGRFVSMTFLRQRENDADRYEARMVGARTFAQTCWRLREMNLASQFAMSDLQSSWHQRRLPDNYPKLILANVPQIPKDVLAEYRKAMGEAKTGLFDTHPSDFDRITHAKVEEPGEGIFNLDGPATDVFRSFDSLARALTFDFYRAILGREISKEQLFSVGELVESQAVAQEGYATADRFFLNARNISHKLPFPWDYPQPAANPKDAKAVLLRTRNELQSTRDRYRDSAKRFEEARSRLEQVETAIVLLKTGVKFKAGSFGLQAANLRTAEAARDEAATDLRELEETFGSFPAAATRRILQALAVLQVETVADHVSHGHDRREEARTLYPCVAHLGANVIPEINALVRTRAVLGATLEIYSQGRNQEDAGCTNAVLRASAALRDRLEEFRWKVGDTIYYPFEHASEDITLARFALPPILPEKNDPGALLQISADAMNKLLTLYHRALGRLAVTAEEVERVLGFEPIAVEDSEEHKV